MNKTQQQKLRPSLEAGNGHPVARQRSLHFHCHCCCVVGKPTKKQAPGLQQYGCEMGAAGILAGQRLGGGVWVELVAVDFGRVEAVHVSSDVEQLAAGKNLPGQLRSVQRQLHATTRLRHLGIPAAEVRI